MYIYYIILYLFSGVEALPVAATRECDFFPNPSAQGPARLYGCNEAASRAAGRCRMYCINIHSDNVVIYI